MGFSKPEYCSGLPFPSPGESSQPRNRTQVSCMASRFSTIWATREALSWNSTLQKSPLNDPCSASGPSLVEVPFGRASLRSWGLGRAVTSKRGLKALLIMDETPPFSCLLGLWVLWSSLACLWTWGFYADSQIGAPQAPSTEVLARGACRARQHWVTSAASGASDLIHLGPPGASPHVSCCFRDSILCKGLKF